VGTTFIRQCSGDWWRFSKFTCLGGQQETKFATYSKVAINWPTGTAYSLILPIFSHQRGRETPPNPWLQPFSKPLSWHGDDPINCMWWTSDCYSSIALFLLPLQTCFNDLLPSGSYSTNSFISLKTNFMLSDEWPHRASMSISGHMLRRPTVSVRVSKNWVRDRVLELSSCFIVG